MDYTCFRLNVDEGIAVVTFDRPPVNAQNRLSREEFVHLFDTLSDRDDVRVVILTAAGHVFSAGADVKERIDLAKEAGDYPRHNRLTREFFYAASDCQKPVIVAVNGPAIGAGFAAGAGLRHHVGGGRRLFCHARTRCRTGWRRALPDGAF